MKYLLVAVLALAGFQAQATLTDEKWAFARANPCPVNGFKRYYGCSPWVVWYPSCEPWATSMRWVLSTDKLAWDARGKAYCACKSRPVEVSACTSRGCRVLAVSCRL